MSVRPTFFRRLYSALAGSTSQIVTIQVVKPCYLVGIDWSANFSPTSFVTWSSLLGGIVFGTSGAQMATNDSQNVISELRIGTDGLAGSTNVGWSIYSQKYVGPICIPINKNQILGMYHEVAQASTSQLSCHLHFTAA